MRSHWSTAVLLVLLVATTVVPLFGLGAASTGVAAPASGAHAVSATDSTGTVAVAPENNTTSTPVPRHRNPENRSEFGNLGQYERWLAGRMGEVLVDCTAGARARQFGACDVDSEYPDWLNKYVDVARATENESDDEAADAFGDAKEDQRTFNDKVERFWRTYQAYQEARDRGDTAQARRLARRLGRLAGDVNDTSGALLTDYRRISNTTQVDLRESARTVERIDQNITTTANDVEADLFIATTLSVRANATETSFLQPLVVSGRLTTENGSALSDRPIRLAIAGRIVRTETDADGRFTLTYRPTTLSLDTDRVSVRYVPRNASAYLPAEATLPVTVEQVEPTVTVTRSPSVVAFGETVVVAGSVSADGVAAPDVPVRVSIAGAHSTTVATDADGTYRVQVSVPATVPDGTQQVRATIPLDGRALRSANATTTVTIRKTATDLTLNGVDDGGNAVRVSGQLTTIDGEPVAGQPVRLTLNGTTLGTVQTGRDGGYATTVTVPRELFATAASNGSVRIAAQFEATGTNLAPANNTTTVRIPREALGPDPGQDQSQSSVTLQTVRQALTDELTTWLWWQWLLAGLAIVALLGGLALGWRRWPLVRQYLGPFAVVGRKLGHALWLPVRLLPLGGTNEQPAEATGVEGAESAAGDTAASATDGEHGEPDVEPLERAHQQLERGDTDGAVQMAYAVVRERISTLVEPTPGATHWEFYNAARERLATEEGNALQRLTEAYEAAAFARTRVGADTAQKALDAAERFQEMSGVRSDGGMQSGRTATGDTDPSDT